jgi:hypothetical protein
VFFDDVGWPWPKHPCTDRFQGRDEQIGSAVNSRLRFNFRNRKGMPLDVYRVEQFIELAADLLIRLKNIERGPPILILVSHSEMQKKKITTEDIKEAPSLVLLRDRGDAGETEASFISARLQSVVILGATVLQ